MSRRIPLLGKGGVAALFRTNSRSLLNGADGVVGSDHRLPEVRRTAPSAPNNVTHGLQIKFLFAWRTLIAAELVFGVSSGSGGLGWYIFENKNQLLIPNVFAGLLTVILLGLFVENLIFKSIERVTVRRWGMQV